MFPNQSKGLKPPKGSTESFAVRYRGGRKVFPTRTAAFDFADAQEATEGGWAEVTQAIETVVRKRKP